MRISDWSSDVCSSDLGGQCQQQTAGDDGGEKGAQHEPTPLRSRRGSGCRAPPPWRPACGAARPNGRASCRERVCQYVQSALVAVSLKDKIIIVSCLSRVM